MPKVSQLDRDRLKTRHQNILHLYIPVHNPLAMQMINCRKQLFGNFLHRTLSKQLLGHLDKVCQASVLCVFHHDVDAIFILEHLEDGHDVGVRELLEDGYFSVYQKLLSLNLCILDSLDCKLFLEGQMTSEVNLAVTTLS